MPSYETLDRIADSYNPLLFVAYLIASIIYFLQGDRVAWLKGALSLFLAYGLMFLDKVLLLWQYVGLDYSTHSAVALSLIAFQLHKCRASHPVSIAWITSLIMYYALVIYQGYHSVGDIFSTIAALCPLIYALYRVERYKAWLRQKRISTILGT